MKAANATEQLDAIPKNALKEREGVNFIVFVFNFSFLVKVNVCFKIRPYFTVLNIELNTPVMI